MLINSFWWSKLLWNHSCLWWINICVFRRLAHLHKSRCCDNVPLLNLLTKVATKSWASIWLIPQASYGTNCRQSLIAKTKHVLIWNGKWKLFIHWTLIEKIVLIGRQTITILHHEHPQARLLKSYFCQGIL